MNIKPKHSGRPCPECNKYLYWVIEEREFEGKNKKCSFLECLNCGYSEDDKHKRPRRHKVLEV